MTINPLYLVTAHDPEACKEGLFSVEKIFIEPECDLNQIIFVLIPLAALFAAFALPFVYLI